MNELEENQKILIIGASGTVGSDIVKQLEVSTWSLIKQFEILMIRGKT